jgi:mono/diheme cytochrome c family protein
MHKLFVAVICLTALARAASAQGVDYARDVLPILSENCYHCHGPDEKARKAKLRLDQKDGGAFRTKDGVTPILPHGAAKSDLVRRVTSEDPDEVMPPADDIRKLKPQQIETLKRWVEQGATWGAHWAFVPPVAPAVPKRAARSMPSFSRACRRRS